MVDQAERLREIVKESKINSKLTRVIAITSGKGGVGKTSFAINLGIALSKLGMRVLLVDADLGLANVDVMLGLMPQYNLGHVLIGEKKITDIIINGPSGLKVVASGSGVYKMANLSEKAIEECLQHLNEIEKFTDIMLIDTGAGLSQNVLKFVLAAGEVVVVTTPEPTAITDAYGVIKTIAGADQSMPIWVVVNMIKNENEGFQVIDRLSGVSQRFLGVKLVKMGFIPMDPNVSNAVKKQQPLVISHPRSIASQYINQIAKELLKDAIINVDTTSFLARQIEFQVGEYLEIELLKGEYKGEHICRLVKHNDNKLVVTSPDIDGQIIPIGENDLFKVTIYRRDAKYEFETKKIILGEREDPGLLVILMPEVIRRKQRRSDVRVKVKIPVELLYFYRNGDPVTALTVSSLDLSASGIKIETPEQYQPHVRFKLSLALPGEEKEMYLNAEVVRSGVIKQSEPGATNHYWTVLNFLNITENQQKKIIKFIYKQQELRVKGLI
jgi:flagellar biosynthesis protein FlhG